MATKKIARTGKIVFLLIEPAAIFPKTLTYILLAIVAGLLGSAPPCQAAPSFAFFYGTHPPVKELNAFDVVVVDPGSGISPATYDKSGSQLFAYVSVGETNRAASYAQAIKREWILGRDKAWGSDIMDSANPSWRRFFLQRVITPLWQEGYRGFFLDTLDAYRTAVGKSRFADMENGLVALVRTIKSKYPTARLIFNRGFPLLGRLRPDVFAVVAESLFRGYSPARGGYYRVPAKARAWLLGKLEAVKKVGIPVIAIDYVPPGQRELARRTAARISRLGIVPWVTDKDLSSMGVGSIEVMPRTVLGLFDGTEAADPVYTNILTLAAMPLNYLGYTLELHDMHKPLPRGILAGRYAGVLVWPSRSDSAEPGFRKWLQKTIAEGVKVAFLGYFGMPVQELPRKMGISTYVEKTPALPLRVQKKESIMGFEAPPMPHPDSFHPVRMKKGRVLLRIANGSGQTFDAAAITPWGGYVLNPFVTLPSFNAQTLWEINPFKFLREALRLPAMPVPDTTTENGARLLMAHVDGDGYASRAEWPGGGYAAQELRTKILEKFRIPTTISVITGVIAPDGLYPKKSALFEKFARQIYRLPWVEAGSHSFSHPFKWFALESGENQEGDNLRIPGYTFSLKKEIQGSIDFINRHLLPPGKKVKVFQWTGNCVPNAAAIADTYRIGVGNINGGDTTISRSSPSLTDVAPLGVDKGGWYQVFAPDDNEELYTHLWTADFYGFHRDVETFRLTNKPRRLKPVDIYYHFYSATKLASLKALREVYSWALHRRLNAIFTSQYVAKVLDFRRTVVARTDKGWLVKNDGSLREMRIPQGVGYPEVGEGSNVVGFSSFAGERYIHLGPGGEARIRLLAKKRGRPYIERMNAVLDTFSRTPCGFTLSFHGWLPVRLVLGDAAHCTLRDNGKQIRPQASQGEQKVFAFPKGAHRLDLVCH